MRKFLSVCMRVIKKDEGQIKCRWLKSDLGQKASLLSILRVLGASSLNFFINNVNQCLSIPSQIKGGHFVQALYFDPVSN